MSLKDARRVRTTAARPASEERSQRFDSPTTAEVGPPAVSIGQIGAGRKADAAMDERRLKPLDAARGGGGGEIARSCATRSHEGQASCDATSIAGGDRRSASNETSQLVSPYPSALCGL